MLYLESKISIFIIRINNMVMNNMNYFEIKINMEDKRGLKCNKIIQKKLENKF